MSIEIKTIAYGSEAYDQTLLVRHEVLRRAWGRSIAEDDLSEEDRDFIVGAFDGDRVVGCATMIWRDEELAQPRYMAILETYRKQGIGSRILARLEEEAARRGRRLIRLNARESAIPFYERHGYRLIGEPKIPAFIPIPHAMMEKRLDGGDKMKREHAMQITTVTNLCDDRPMAVLYHDAEALDAVPEGLKPLAAIVRDKGRHEGVVLYRRLGPGEQDVYFVKMARELRDLQKDIHALGLKLASEKAKAVTLVPTEAYESATWLQILKTLKLALPVNNPYAKEGYKPTKDEGENEGNGEEPWLLAEVAVMREAPFEADLITEFEALTDSVALARKLVNEPANRMTPEDLAQYALAIGEACDLEVSVMGPSSIETLGMEAFLAVAQGSDQEPRLIVMRYKGAPDDDRVLALVGKGLMYDSGGYALKPGKGMATMFTDMAGAAAVIGAIRTLAAVNAHCNVTAIVAACENMVSGHAYRNGDIIGSMLGKYIEVANTDAEGRLTLADAVTYAWKYEGASHIIDIATLTGAVVHALGRTMTGALADDETLWQCLVTACDKSGDLVWRLPFHKEYAALNKSDRADINNVGKGYAGTIGAGHFVRAFTGNTPFLHLDIAGTAYLKSPDERHPAGATGVGVELLSRVATELFA